MSEILYGKRPILEALAAQRRRLKKFVYSTAEGEAETQSVLARCRELGIPTQQVQKRWFEDKFPGSLTQGWAAELSPYPYVAFEDLLKKLNAKDSACVLALDQVQDPQNVGAMLRSAEASGVDGVIWPSDRSAPMSPALAKAAAGAQEHLEICQVINLARSMATLKEAGFWVVGTSFPGPSLHVQDALDFDWPAKTLLVLGAEGTGMRRLTKEHCDFLLHLPLLGKISSLNVSAAAAIFLYQNLKSRRISKK